jgi:hypothetical protein
LISGEAGTALVGEPILSCSANDACPEPVKASLH